MRVSLGLLTVLAASAASPALAETPGPFVCGLGDTEATLSANADATEYSGTFELAGDYAGLEREPPEVMTLKQVYAGWRYIYSNDEMTMVIEGDSAKLYGGFGEGDCFASRSTPVGAGWQYGEPGVSEEASGSSDPAPDGDWQVINRGDETWTERKLEGTAITWGGNVRAGPGTDFGRVAGVPLGVTITLMAQTDRRWLESDPWYKVRLPSGMIGYIPGGLLCTRDGREGFFNARNCEG